MQRLRTLILVMCVCFSPRGVHAQQSLDLGSISGQVTDATGGALAGATVTARQVATNLSSSTATDTNGRFRLAYLRTGDYEITVRQSGFEDGSRRMIVNAGTAFDLVFTLALNGINTRVTVTAAAPVLDTARSQVAGLVTASEARNLPLNGRNFLELALLVPGVSPTNVGSAQLFPETSAVPGISLSVSSQRNLSNNFVVDGLSANDDAAALSGSTVGVDAIEQFQVVTSGGQAELGRALGGYINVVTKSGTNVRQGDLYLFGRHNRLNAANPISGTTLPMHQAQFGGSLAGPIVPNRTFYFTNVEHRRLEQSGLVIIDRDAANTINARLVAAGYPGPSMATGLYANPVHSTNVLGKVAHTLTDRDQATLRYSLYDVTAQNARGAGGLSAATASSGLDNRDQTIAVTNTLVLSPRTVFESRGQIAHGDLRAAPTDPVGPAVSIAGVASFGTLSSSPTGRVNTMVQIVNSLSHQAGAHAVRAGIDVLYNRDRIIFPRTARGSYGFSSLANFLSGTYNNAGFTQTFGVTDIEQTNPNVGLYVQDEWHIRSRLTLNLGLRYDLQFLDTISTDRDNVSPRLGVAWSPRASQRTVVRASTGLFYDRVPLRAVANALLSAGNTTDLRQLRQTSVSLSPTQSGAPIFPNILVSAVPAVTLVNFTTMDRQLENAYSRQAAIEIEQQVGAHMTVSAAYQYVRGVGLLMSINQNVPSCVAAGANNGCRPNPAYANNSQYSAAGSSTYHGLHVSLLQRPARWGNYRVSYTLSKSMNNVGEFFFSSPIDPFDLSKDWGRSDDDQRHRLVVAGTLQATTETPTTTWQHLARGFALTGMLQWYSAAPFNITSGVTTVQGTTGRPLTNGAFIARNAGVGSDTLMLSLRLSRAFPLGPGRSIEGVVEAFNLTNHRNVLTRNTNFGAGTYPTNPSSTFGQITAVGEPRSLQLGARVRF